MIENGKNLEILGYVVYKKRRRIQRLYYLLKKILSIYEHIFDKTHGLPPLRGREHAITLKAGTIAINFRPYRYPQAHKEVMSVMVAKMLDKGLIRASISSFYSPILLEKKHDKS